MSPRRLSLLPGAWRDASPAEVRAAARRYLPGARGSVDRLRRLLAEAEADEELSPGSFLDVVREGHS